MKCEACGTAVVEEAVFCQKCGHRIGEPAGKGDSSGGSGGEDAAALSSKPVAQTPAERLRSKIGGDDDDDEEEVLWEGGYSAKAMIGAWVSGVLLSALALVGGFFIPGIGLMIGAIIVIGIWVVLACWLAYRKLEIAYELTTQRFVHRHGILRRTTDRIEVIDMDDVTFEQGLIQRMINVGKIKIESSDRSHPVLILEGIDEVEKVANMIDDVRRKERRRRGLHIEAI